jgi:polar amino acid transport system substrate-binding protein
MRTRTALLAVALAASLTACAAPEEKPATAVPAAVTVNNGPDQNRIVPAKVDAAAALVPEKIRATGKLTIGVGAAGSGFAPLAFTATDNKTLIGSEPDIAVAVAGVLGLEPDLQNTSWESLFIGLDSGKFDVGASNITVTEERKQKYDFATYRQDELAFEAKKGAGWTVTGPKDVAGKKVAVGSGAIDAYLGPNPTSAYHVAVAGQTEIIGTYSGAGKSLQGLIALTTKKDNGLVPALKAALDELVRSGDYTKILARWNLTNEAVTAAEVNPPGLPIEGK